jgi:subfamily B ATP-binding cassette protein MsbA
MALLAGYISRAATRWRQLSLVMGWMYGLTRESLGIVYVFIAASVLNAMTDGLSVLLVVPFVNSTGQNAFAGLPLLGSVGDFFAHMEVDVRLRWIALLILVIVLLRGALQYFVEIIIYIIPYRIDQTLRMRAYRALMAAKMSFIDSMSAGEVVSFTSNHPVRVGIATRFIGQIFSNAITIVLMLILLLTITPVIWVAIGVFAIVTSVIFKKVTGPLVYSSSRALTDQFARFNQVFFEAIQNRKSIKIFRASEQFAENLLVFIDALRRTQLKALMIQSATYPFFSTAAGVSVCVVMLAASLLRPQDSETLLGLLVVSLVVLFRLLGPFTTLHIARMHFVTNLDAVQELHTFLENCEKEKDIDGRIELGNVRGELLFEDVHYEYAPETPVLRGVTFRAAPGETVAIVGRSGAGKSTIFNLVTRLYRPSEGRILIDGVDLNDVVGETWWRNISYVSQEAPIFSGTVDRNITFGADAVKVNSERALRAAEMAAATDFIKELPEGFSTVIGDGGRALSGGERQRIVLARSFYARAPIILFDEATSQLDALTESKVQESVATLQNGQRTLLIIAHRLSTVKNADRILVLDEGKIVETGTFRSLIAKQGLFTEMVESQSLK